MTIGGAVAGIVTDAERRGVPVFSPGGYFWKPTAGDSMLVIKCGSGEVCAVGNEISVYPENVQEGEICIMSKGGAELRLRNDGTIEIAGVLNVKGGLMINGNPVA